VNVSADDAIAVAHDTEAAWLATRLAGITSSDAPVLFGVSPFVSAFQLYAQKIGVAEASVEDNDAMRWGVILEPVVAAEYARRHDVALVDPGRFTVFRSRLRPWQMATIDRQMRDAPVIVEIKTTSWFMREEWDDEPPLPVLVQVQHQLDVRGWPAAVVVVLIGGRILLTRNVDRNDAFIAVMREREEEFRDRIARRDPPSPDAAANAIMRRLYPTAKPDTSVDLPDAAVAWDRARTEALAQIGHWKSIIDEAEAKLKASIGDAECGILPAGGRYLWSNVPVKGYPVEARIDRRFRRLKR